MSHRGRIAIFLVATVAGTTLILLTRPASTAGPWDGWGCPPAQIGHSVYDFVSDASGFASADEALRAEADFQAADGALEGDRYLEAVISRTGPTRYVPDTGDLYVDGSIYARFVPSRLEDGTWVVASITNCGPPPPVGNSPGPTPA
jgi:hypothetical protein